MAEMILETLLDTGKTMPFLFGIYFFIEWLQSRSKKHPIHAEKYDKYGPILASAAGCLPQCGFSIMAATLYSNKVIRGGTLIAAFIATSDEAIPIIIASGTNGSLLLIIIALKFFLGVLVGYVLNATFYKHEVINDQLQVDVKLSSCENQHHHEEHGVSLKIIFPSAIYHTIKISIFIVLVLLLINLSVFYLGEARLARILLSGNILQPFVIGLLGMVPGCSTSVLITELLLAGQIPFGSAMAGLCTSTGFGYIVLFKICDKKDIFKILFLTYFCGSIIGFTISLISTL